MGKDNSLNKYIIHLPKPKEKLLSTYIFDCKLYLKFYSTSLDILHPFFEYQSDKLYLF